MYTLTVCVYIQFEVTMTSEFVSNAVEAFENHLDGMYKWDNDGGLKPYVCIVCDKLLRVDEISFIRQKALKKASSLLSVPLDATLPDDIRKQYEYGILKEGYCEEFDNMILSRRAIAEKKGNDYQYSCCRRCKSNLSKKNTSVCNKRL